jgi:hypothetical protein
MPFIDNTTAFEQKHTASSETNSYLYSSLTLNASLTDAAQIQLRYVPTTIHVGGAQGVGTATATNSLSDRILEILTVIPTTAYTVNASANTITFNLSSLQGTSRQIDGVDYFYAASLSVSTTEPIVIRRSTSLNDKSVSFQAGSRLTSTSLNLAVDQLFNASQELTAFGGSGGSGVSADELSLSGYSITDLGDVNAFGSAGPLTFNASTNKVEIGALGTTPIPGASDNGKYLGATDANGAFGWVAFDIQGSNVAYDGSNSVNDKINANISNISSNDTDITNLQNKTTALTYDASTGFAFTGNITNGTSSLTTGALTASSATVGGVPVTDRFFFGHAANNKSETTVITGTGTRSLIASNDLEQVFTYTGNSEGLASLVSTGNTKDKNHIKIPRDMTVRCMLNYTARPQQSTKSFGGAFILPYKNIDWTSVSTTDRSTFNSYQIGEGAYQYIYNNSSTSSFYDLIHSMKEWVFDLNANDQFYLLAWRWGANGSVDNTNYSSVKIDYARFSLEEIFPPGLGTGTIPS